MKSLLIHETKDTPEVIFNIESGTFSITGSSLPESAIDFYKPLIAWLGEYKDDPLEATNFDIKLKYFNTSSSKWLVQLLMALEKIAMHSKVTINWYYKRKDTTMFSAVTTYSKRFKLKFNLIQY
ncbi:MAG: DUF1987 domain-containing protein [Bacteroidia bacterium]|nr:DUF1987 domain-containing protein [Bacteroidia bacterium]